MGVRLQTTTEICHQKPNEQPETKVKATKKCHKEEDCDITMKKCYKKRHHDSLTEEKGSHNRDSVPVNRALCRQTITKSRAEKLCKTKLKLYSKDKSRLYETVLIKNTLRLVQGCDDDPYELVEKEEPNPPAKKPRLEEINLEDITIHDIDEILNEMFFPHFLLESVDNEDFFDCSSETTNFLRDNNNWKAAMKT